jgi:hypothetical protein
MGYGIRNPVLQYSTTPTLQPYAMTSRCSQISCSDLAMLIAESESLSTRAGARSNLLFLCLTLPPK